MQLFGSKIKATILAISLICLLGVSLGSIVYLKNVIVGLIFSFTDDVHPLLSNTTFWAIVFCEGIMLPLSCMPRMKGISYISSFTSILLFSFLYQLFLTTSYMALISKGKVLSFSFQIIPITTQKASVFQSTLSWFILTFLLFSAN